MPLRPTQPQRDFAIMGNVPRQIPPGTEQVVIRRKMCTCLVNPAQIGPIRAHAEVPVAHYQAFLRKYAEKAQ
jgi:hypothetical protein